MLLEDLNTVWGYDAVSGALDCDEPASLYLRAEKAGGGVLLLFMGFEYPQAILSLDFQLCSSIHPPHSHPDSHTPRPRRAYWNSS